MVSFPFCKINLGLDILGKREDGYHDIETCFYPVPLTDILEIIPGKSLVFSASGNDIPGKKDDNLCLKAYHLLKEEFDLPPVSIHLHKIIPTGAGLGGGSSDGAHTLRTLNTLFDLKISNEKLRQYAARLGSDCAFFISDIPQTAKGRGEILHPAEVSLEDKFFILLNPGLHVSTAEAYSGVVPCLPRISIEETIKLPCGEWKNVLKNDFEISIFRKFPEIKKLKDILYEAGAEYASMSGSGASVYGIFSGETSPSLVGDELIWKGFLHQAKAE